MGVAGNGVFWPRIVGFRLINERDDCWLVNWDVGDAGEEGFGGEGLSRLWKVPLAAVMAAILAEVEMYKHYF